MLLGILNLPFDPFFGIHILSDLVALAGIVFSVIMLIDCLKRPDSKFYYPIIKRGDYDKLIWAVLIMLSLRFFFIGAIAYFFVVKNTEPRDK